VINLIVAVSLNGVIGCDGKLAHLIPEDLKRFKSLTSGCVVIMGRKTFQSILDLKGKPLLNRQNIILTRDQSLRDTSFKFENTLVINNFDELQTELPIWIIGGAEVYNLLLPKVEKMYVTHIHRTLDGDKYFSPDWSQWQVESFEEKDYFSWVNYTKK
jgi:dihydrofolate reductase